MGTTDEERGRPQHERLITVLTRCGLGNQAVAVDTAATHAHGRSFRGRRRADPPIAGRQEHRLIRCIEGFDPNPAFDAPRVQNATDLDEVDGGRSQSLLDHCAAGAALVWLLISRVTVGETWAPLDAQY